MPKLRSKRVTARPYVICHILQSIDGRISGKFFGDPAVVSLSKEYGKLSASFKADAIVYGSATANRLFIHDAQPEPTPVTNDMGDVRTDFVRADANQYIVVLDPHARLGWSEGHVERSGVRRVIELLSASVPNEVLAYYRAHDVAYIIAGEQQLDLPLALEKLAKQYGMRRIVLQGGGAADAQFAAADLIDEISLVVAPVIDGTDATLLIDHRKAGVLPVMRSFNNVSVRKLGGAGLWIDYTR